MPFIRSLVSKRRTCVVSMILLFSKIMPFIRSLVSKRRTCVVSMILLFSKIMPLCSCYTEKKLVCIIIIAFFNYQPFFYIKYIKLNMYLFYNIRLVSNTKYL